MDRKELNQRRAEQVTKEAAARRRGDIAAVMQARYDLGQVDDQLAELDRLEALGDLAS
jgi:hypothetical protein